MNITGTKKTLRALTLMLLKSKLSQVTQDGWEPKFRGKGE
jgi:hypothetical protein